MIKTNNGYPHSYEYYGKVMYPTKLVYKGDDITIYSIQDSHRLYYHLVQNTTNRLRELGTSEGIREFGKYWTQSARDREYLESFQPLTELKPVYQWLVLDYNLTFTYKVIVYLSELVYYQKFNHDINDMVGESDKQVMSLPNYQYFLVDLVKQCYKQLSNVDFITRNSVFLILKYDKNCHSLYIWNRYMRFCDVKNYFCMSIIRDKLDFNVCNRFYEDYLIHELFGG